MKQYLADLHIHTCLSPCGSLEMSPSEIVRRSLAKGLDAIAITDHNTTLQCPEIQSLGERFGLRVFAGVEVTTREEAHCLVYFPTDESRKRFQRYLEEHLPPIPNDPERFGDQVWVNAENEILGEVPYLLLSALDQSVNQIAAQQTQYSASDAHCPEQIGTQPSIWQTEELTFDGLRKAFDQKDNHLIFASHG